MIEKATELFATVWEPADLTRRAFDLRGVLEGSKRLRRWRLVRGLFLIRGPLGVRKVVLVDVDCDILRQGRINLVDQGLDLAEIFLVLLHLFAVPRGLLLFGIVEVLGPAS